MNLSLVVCRSTKRSQNAVLRDAYEVSWALLYIYTVVYILDVDLSPNFGSNF